MRFLFALPLTGLLALLATPLFAETSLRPHPDIAVFEGGVIARYAFEGNLSDDSGNGLNPIHTRGPVRFEPGRSGQALVFDGETVVELPLELRPDLYPEITVSFSFRIDPADDRTRLAYVLSNSYHGLIELTNLGAEEPSLRVLNAGVVSDYVTGEIRPGEWTDVTLTTRLVGTGRTQRIRAELSMADSEHVWENAYNPGMTGPTLYVGAANGNAGYGFNGAIDELTVSVGKALVVERNGSSERSGPVTRRSADESPIARFSFDGDTSADDGSVRAAASQGVEFVPGLFGQAAAFGGDAFLELPLELDRERYPEQTVSLWMRFDGATETGGNTAYVLSNSYNGLLELSGISSRPYLRALAGVVAGEAGTHLPHPGRWLHVAVVSRVQDGITTVEIHSGSQVTRRVANFEGARVWPSLFVGNYTAQSQYGFHGAIDELAVYDRALSEAEIIAIAQQARAAQDARERFATIGRETPLGDFDPNPDISDLDPAVQERVDSVEEAAQLPDWALTEIVAVNPRDVIPGDLISVRVRVTKHDPLNVMPEVRLNVVGTNFERIVRLDTSTESPEASLSTDIHWAVPRDFQFGGSESVPLDLIAAITRPDGTALEDREPRNDGRRANVTVYEPLAEVCGDLTFYDSRRHRSDSPGSRLTSANNKTFAPIGGLTVELWEMQGSCKDIDPTCGERRDNKVDETIADPVTGRFCLNGPRRGTAYLRVPLETDVARVKGRDKKLVTVWSGEQTFAAADAGRTMNWAISCTSGGGDCSSLTPLNGTSQQNIDWGNTLATINLVQKHYGGDISPKIDFYVTNDANPDCSGPFSGSNNAARESSYVCVFTPRSNYRVAHEIGHIVMNRALDIGTNLASDCKGDSGFDEKDNEKCATTEGFANFFSSAIFFTATAEEPIYHEAERVLESDIALGNNGVEKACISIDDNPQSIEGNVARFFWDLYDANQEVANIEDLYDLTTAPVEITGTIADNDQHSLEDLVAVWANFDPGEGQGQAEEGGTPGQNNGRNAWDFACHLPSAKSEILLNCMAAQEPPGDGCVSL